MNIIAQSKDCQSHNEPFAMANIYIFSIHKSIERNLLTNLVILFPVISFKVMDLPCFGELQLTFVLFHFLFLSVLNERQRAILEEFAQEEISFANSNSTEGNW